MIYRKIITYRETRMHFIFGFAWIVTHPLTKVKITRIILHLLINSYNETCLYLEYVVKLLYFFSNEIDWWMVVEYHKVKLVDSLRFIYLLTNKVRAPSRLRIPREYFRLISLVRQLALIIYPKLCWLCICKLHTLFLMYTLKLPP